MKKAIVTFSVLLLVGLGLVVVGGYYNSEAFKTISGVCLGLGAGLTGMSIAKLISALILQRHPEQLRRQQIEETDERNAAIRDKAKGKGFDAMSIIYATAMLICVLLNAGLAIILVMVGAYLAVYAVQLYYLSKYSGEM